MKNLLFILFLFTSQIFPQTKYTQKDVKVCKSTFEFAVSNKLSQKPINKIVVEIGKKFLGTDYQAHTIENGKNEEVVINLSAFDCYTFLESVLALSRCVRNDRNDFDSYISEIKNLRYRKGRLKNYTSRLHYFTDWIYDVSKRKITKDVTKEIGGVKYKNTVNFMSKNNNLYARLKTNPSFIEEMELIESIISDRDYYYIPQNKIAKSEKNINSGDIIGITTNISGLDIAHTGIAIKLPSGRIHLLHAPSQGKKVQITDKPLSDYIKKNKRQTGIIVARPI